MSILQYFSHESKLPNPRGILNRQIPPSAIAAANEEVRRLTAKNPKHRGSYHKYTPKERAAIGKFAHENGVQAARRKFRGLLKIDINESTVRLFKKQYKMELKEKRTQQASKLTDGREEDCLADPTISELHSKKRGRKVLLGDKCD